MHDIIRVLIADAEPIVAHGINTILSDMTDVRIVGRATCVQKALYLADTLRPHLVIMETLMPYLEDGEATLEIDAAESAFHLKRITPDIRVIIFSGQTQDERLESLKRMGVSAYVSKRAPISTLYQAIRVVHRGGTYFSGSVNRPDRLDVSRGITWDKKEITFKPFQMWPYQERRYQVRRRWERRAGERRALNMLQFSSLTISRRRKGHDRRREDRRQRERRACS